MKKCKSFEKQLVAYIHGELNETQVENLEQHLEQCASCRAELTAERSTLDLLGEGLESAPAPEQLNPWRSLRYRDTLPKNLFEKIWYGPQLKSMLAAGAISSLFVLISGSLVVFTVVNKQEVSFEPPRSNERPKMKLKRPSVRMRKSSSPKSTHLVASKSYRGAVMPNIDVPPVGGYRSADGFDMMADLDEEGYYYGSSVGFVEQEFNTEQYSRIEENPFKLALQNPLSTFSIDVDRAAYANVRRFLNYNQLPPPDAVRLEEMINYFSYDYPQPGGRAPFSVNMDLAECPWNEKHQLVLIGLQGLEVELEKLPPNNLVFLLDVSGSMDNPDKLPLLKSAMRLLVNELRPEDRVSIVVYAGAAGLVLEPTSDKGKILKAIERLNAGGSTAGGAGIELAYKKALESFIKEGNNRVILATDGDFNVGISSDGALTRLIEEKRETGIYLSVLGFGTGNYKDSKMEQLADKGNGNYAYIDNILEAKKVLVTEMGGTLVTIAKDVKIQIEFNPAAVKAYRLIGYENRMLAAEDFDDDKKDAGELGAGHTVTALYELILAESDEDVPAAGALRYQTTKLVSSDELMSVKLRYKEPDSDTSDLIVEVLEADPAVLAVNDRNIEFASAVAEFGMLLRNSAYKGSADYDRILLRARQAKGSDANGYRAEFIRLVEKAQLLDAENE